MRIISGTHGGRIINPPKNLRARPTTDFAKENIFNVLTQYVDFDGATALSDVLLRLRETVETLRLTVSLPYEGASASALSISFSGALGAAYGDGHMILSLALTLETAGEK